MAKYAPLFVCSYWLYVMRIMLAPMEGVLDSLVRELLTEINQYDLCVTEFVRVVNTLLPAKTYYRLCPELNHGGYTQSGTPVRVQLLGHSPDWLAENAAKAIELGSHGIDLNCGCPAKKVVGSDGGASLLKTPELIYQITSAVRKALPIEQPLSVKVRLGWDTIDARFEIADAVQQGGATEIVVHGRTKEDGYKADKINWQAIGEIRQRLSIPVIANGEIMDAESAARCRQITQCQDLMVGRGALNLPNLGAVIQQHTAPYRWQQVVALLYRYIHMQNAYDSGFYHVARIKQWLNYLRHQYTEATELFREIRTLHSAADMALVIAKWHQADQD